MLERIQNKFLRLVFIIAIAACGIAIWSVLPRVSAMFWHMRHGNTVLIEEHSFIIPMFYGPSELGISERMSDLRKTYPFANEWSSLNIEAGEKKTDLQTATRWQQFLTTSTEGYKNVADLKPSALHGAKMNFVCVEGYKPWPSLMCHVVDSDLVIDLNSTSKEDFDQLKRVLETSK